MGRCACMGGVPTSSVTALGRVLAVGTGCPMRAQDPGCLPLDQHRSAIGLLSALHLLLCLPLYVTLLNCEQHSGLRSVWLLQSS